MNVISSLGQVKCPDRKPRVLVIGVFDGLHIGHQKLFQQARDRAKALGGEFWVMTFDPHPVHVLHPEVNLPLIISLPHRLRLFQDMGVDTTLLVRFDRAFARMTPSAFIKKYLVGAIDPVEVYVGDDFRFGKDRTGSLAIFEKAGEKFGFTVCAVAPVAGDVGKVSSTQIRHLIVEGNLRKAAKFLGRPVSLMGRVVKGDGRGRVLGFPTVNFTPTNELFPPMGVYAVEVDIRGRLYQGMTNIGQRPSFTPLEENIFIETHIFNFKKDVYGEDIIIYFHKKMRNERRFSSQEALIAQLRRDQQKAKSFLGFAKQSVK